MSHAHELRSLIEILDVCYTDLHCLLMTDHPPPDHLERIAKERQTIEEIEYLIADAEGVRHVPESHSIGLFTAEEIGAAIRAAGLAWEFESPGLTGRGLHLGRRPD